MSENTIRAALRRMGYTNEEMTAHGFRAMAHCCPVKCEAQSRQSLIGGVAALDMKGYRTH